MICVKNSVIKSILMVSFVVSINVFFFVYIRFGWCIYCWKVYNVVKWIIFKYDGLKFGKGVNLK